MTKKTEPSLWLQYPSWLGYPETIPLHMPREAYSVVQDGDTWVLRIDESGTEEYRGIGPIKVVDEPVPF